MPLLLALLLTCLALPAKADSISITLTSPGVGNVTVTSTISAADMVTMSAWCQAGYAGNAAAGTSLGCFKVWAADITNQLSANVVQYQKGQAATTAAAAVKAVVIPPAQ